jgi:hypothetical protein
MFENWTTAVVGKYDIPTHLNEFKSGDALKRLVKTQKSERSQLTQRAVGREFQHIEDLVYIEGIPGIKRALDSLADISAGVHPLELKVDGSPALIFGRDSSGTFHFGDKYAKQILSTPEAVYAYFIRNDSTPARQKFAQTMAALCPIFAGATPREFRGFLEAGLMWSSTPPKSASGQYYFTPNTVTYSVSPDSELGARIAESKAGAWATAFFNQIPGLGGTRTPVGDRTAIFNNTPSLVIIPPKFTQGGVDINTRSLQTIMAYATKMRGPITQFLSNDISNTIYQYINSMVEVEGGLSDLNNGFVDWVNTSTKIPAAQQSTIVGAVTSNSTGALAVFKIVEAIARIKNSIISQLEQNTLGSLGITAKLKSGEQGGEGFVYDPNSGKQPIKLVNRATFTKANRMRELNEDAGTDSTVVVAWGRGMGHLGHMYLASAVITTANQCGGTPRFYVSETVGKEDPLLPEEKLAIYKKVFPKQAAIFSSAHTPLETLRELYSEGYKNLIFITGDDQVEAFRFLGEPSKTTGKLPVPFNSVRVISRQETQDPYAREAGPRATPMRDILTNPNATTQQKYALWRRDMPRTLSDSDVQQYMTIAAQRLNSPIDPK